MSKRNKQGLTTRQAKFLNTLALGHGTTESVERQLGLAKYTLRRWMDEPRFMEAWAKTNLLLELRRGADQAIAGIRSPAAAPTPSTDPADAPMKQAIEALAIDLAREVRSPHVRREPDPPPRRSDRDLIRLRHGEEAARMFDELRRRHAADAADAADAAPPPTGAPLIPVARA